MLSRSERQWQILVSEYKICRQKLRSKRDAQKILMQTIANGESERDILLLKIQSLETAASELVTKSAGRPNLDKFGIPGEATEEGRSALQGLILLYSRLSSELDGKRELLKQSQSENRDLIRDLKALRSDKAGHNRVTSPVHPDGDRDKFLHSIQSLKEEVDELQTRIKTLTDEAADFRTEREFYKQKLKSVTEQLSEKSECQPIADIEKLLEENRILRDKVDRLQHINAALVAHTPPGRGVGDQGTAGHRPSPSLHTRNYPGSSSMKKRRSKSRGKHVTFEGEEGSGGGMGGDEGLTAGGFLRSVRDKVSVESEIHNLQALILDMQRVSNGLAETVLDKNIALKHQRASNRLLGERVTELEAKLRALEMSGFWNVPEDVFSSDDPVRGDALKRLTLEPVGSASDGEGEEVPGGASLLLDTGEGDWHLVGRQEEEEEGEECSEMSELLRPVTPPMEKPSVTSDDLCDLLPVKEGW